MEQGAVVLAVITGVLFIGYAIKGITDVMAEAAVQVGRVGCEQQHTLACCAQATIAKHASVMLQITCLLLPPRISWHAYFSITSVNNCSSSRFVHVRL
jgi:hypothetical protein